MAEKKIEYKFSTGLWKSLKNLAIVVGVPALILFVDNWATVIPDEWTIYFVPIMGFVSYFVKNVIEVKYLKK